MKVAGAGIDLMIRSYRDCHEVLRSHKFAGSAGRPEGRAFLGESVLLVDGEEHRDRRQLYLPLVREPRLQGLEATVVVPVLEAAMARHLRPGDDGTRRGDFVTLARDVCMRVAVAVIGFDGWAEPSVADRLFQLLGPLGAGAAVEWSERDHDEVIREGLAAKQAYVDEFFAPAWRRRTEERDAGRAVGEKDADLLSLMAANWRPHWDDDLAVRESILFLAGSTGNPVGQIVYALDDLRAWVAAHPEDAGLLDDEPFVRRGIDETLRLHIAGSPVLVRRALDDVVLGSGLAVGRDQVVGVDLVAANRDPDVFGSDADVYDPRRAARLPDRVAAYGLAFGGGPHLCLGRPLVLGRGMRVGIEGLEYVVLRAALDAGLRPDPGRPAALTTGGQLQYAAYPVVAS